MVYLNEFVKGLQTIGSLQAECTQNECLFSCRMMPNNESLEETKVLEDFPLSRCTCLQ